MSLILAHILGMAHAEERSLAEEEVAQRTAEGCDAGTHRVKLAARGLQTGPAIRTPSWRPLLMSRGSHPGAYRPCDSSLRHMPDWTAALGEALIADPWFYAVAIPAVLLMGVSKSGFGAGFGSLAVPIMALAIPVPQAAAIMLPLLLVE